MDTTDPNNELGSKLIAAAQLPLRGERIQAASAVYWKVVEGNTVGEEIGKALLSGAIGLPAPLLVGGSGSTANTGLLVVTEHKVYLLHCERLATGSPDAILAAMTKLLPKPKSNKTESISPLDVEVNGSQLTITREGAQAAIPLRVMIMPYVGLASASELADHIRSRLKFITPSQLMADVIEGSWSERLDEIERACADDEYMKKFFISVNLSKRETRSSFILAASTGPTCLMIRTEAFLEAASKSSWNRRPVAIVIGIWLVLFGIELFGFAHGWDPHLSSGLDWLIVFGGVIGGSIATAVLIFTGILLICNHVFFVLWYRTQLSEFRQLSRLQKQRGTD